MEASIQQRSSDRRPSGPVSFEPSARAARIRSAILEAPLSICLERPRLLFRFSLSRGGRRAAKDHPLVRRARALTYVMAHRKPRIYDDELIAGNMTSKRLAANFYPEGGSVNILEDLPRLEKRHVPLFLTRVEKLKATALGIWGLQHSVAGRALLRPGRFSHFLDFFRASRYFVTEEAGVGHQVADYHMVVRQGLEQPYQLALKSLQSRAMEDGSPLTLDQEAFYQSVAVTIDGIQSMAANLAAECRRLASKEGEQRKGELLSMAQNLDRVPFHPARTFAQGLQACWLVHVAMNLEDFEQGMSFGRLDQILWPLYEADLEAGRLDREGAVELLASFMFKTSETWPLYSERIDPYFSGNGVAQGVTVGGGGADGRDDTNELSGLMLDAYAQVRLREPALHARIHPKTPAWFWDKCAALVQAGCAKPSFFNDQKVRPALEGAGISPEHAADYAVIGCVEMASQGRTYNSSDAALFNLPLCLELALNQGRRFNGKQAGVKTGAVETMAGMKAVLAAFQAQVDDAVGEMSRVISWLEAAYRIHRPTPVNSLCTQGCLETGRDVTWGGGMYDFTSIQCVGLADAGDSLYAINRLVFEEERLSLARLVEILKNNFAGHEDLRREILHQFPHYGNNRPEVDKWAQAAADVFTKSVTARRNTRGGKYIAGFYSMTCHQVYGGLTGALPSGRLAGERFANGMAPTDGMDRTGPTGLLASAAGLDTSQWANCGALNIKFTYPQVQGQKGRKLLAELLQGYFRMGGMQVQVNVLDPETLKQAKKRPEDHKGLVVRVAGYCAHFIDLRPPTQDEIIQRTGHGLGQL